MSTRNSESIPFALIPCNVRTNQPSSQSRIRQSLHWTDAFTCTNLNNCYNRIAPTHNFNTIYFPMRILFVLVIPETPPIIPIEVRHSVGIKHLSYNDWSIFLSSSGTEPSHI